MQVHAIGYIEGFEYENPDEELNLFIFNLLKGKEKALSFFHNEMIINYYGLNKLLKTEKNYLITFEGESSVTPTLERIVSGGELIHTINSLMFIMLNSLWFIKDNSVFNTSCLMADNTSLILFNDDRNTMNSTARGNYVTTNFTKDEIDTLSIFLIDILLIQTSDATDIDDVIDDDSGIKRGGMSRKDYNKGGNRIKRALMFLGLARGTSLLPMKISFYVGILECLFTTDNTEVSHKVTERATLYLGGDVEDKYYNFETIKNTYSIRSKFLHGQQLDKKHNNREVLEEYSERLDNILRTILTQVIRIDKDVFLNDKLLNDFFIELLLGVRPTL